MDKHAAYEGGGYYAFTDEDDVDHFTNTYPVWCGDYDRHGVALCGKHEAEMKERYPQGWSYYPGDTCKHGKLVGGCGIDLMCQQCESE